MVVFPTTELAETEERIDTSLHASKEYRGSRKNRIVKVLTEESTYHPRKRTLVPGENFGRPESKVNVVGSGPF
jgi:hypothetical protein